MKSYINFGVLLGSVLLLPVFAHAQSANSIAWRSGGQLVAANDFVSVQQGQPGEPGHADGTGGAGGAGGGTSGAAGGTSVRYEAADLSGDAADGPRVYMEHIQRPFRLKPSELPEVDSAPGQPGEAGHADGTGGRGGAGGVSGPVHIRVIAPEVVTPVVATNQGPIVRSLEYACSNGKDFALFVRPKSEYMKDNGTTHLHQIIAFCPQHYDTDSFSISREDVIACRGEKLSDLDRTCLTEFNELNAPTKVDSNRRYVPLRIQQGRPVLEWAQLATLEKICGVNMGEGGPLSATECERQLPSSTLTTAREFTCLERNIKAIGVQNSTPQQLKCYRAIVKVKAQLKLQPHLINEHFATGAVQQ